MEFYVLNLERNKTIYYYIVLNGQRCFYTEDDEMAKLLSMTYEDYTDLVVSFGGIMYSDKLGLIFENKEKAQKFADFLNNKYILILRLCGKI